MSDRIPDADHAVDEQKRRARRRFVGAVILAAAAAVILPMLLEKDPQPLGEDVSVQIPPIDEGKFVNRLTPGKSGDATSSAKVDSKGAPPAAKPEPPKVDAAKADAAKADAVKADAAKADAAKAAEAAKAETPAVVGTKSDAPIAKPATDSAAAPSPSSAGASTPTASASAPAPGQRAPTTATKPAADVTSSASTKPAPAPAAAAAADAKSPPSAGFVVQLAAFSDDKGANAYANKLRKAGYAAAHVEAVDTSHGKLWRVRVGGFATRADAEAARVKLESKGFANGMVAPAR